MATDNSTPRWSTKDRALVRTVTELLEAGQYERLAELLDRVRLACEQEGDTLPAHTLDLARRICLACSQSQAEAEWHQQAREEAAQREDKLRHQLNTLLDLAGERDRIPDAPALPEPAEPPSLRQRLQDLLRRRPGPEPPGRVASEAPVQELASPPLDQSEVHVLSRSEEIQAPAERFAEEADGLTLSPAQAEEMAASSPQEPEDEGAAVSLAKAEKKKEPGPPSLVIHCLGPFRVYNNLNLIEKWPGLKCKTIFKYMIFHRRNPIHREVLAELFWPEAEREAGCRNLYQAIYNLRQALKAGGDGFPYVLCEDSCYELNPDVDLWIDSEEFLSHHQSGRKLERAGRLQEAIQEYELAENLYEGEFLSEDRYEDWPVIERENLKHTYLDVLDRLSRFYFEQAHFNVCIAFCQKILAEDNCREDIHRRLMRCFFRCDQLHLTIRQYHLCVETLNRELDVPPMPATVELYQQIRSTRVQIQGA